MEIKNTKESNIKRVKKVIGEQAKFTGKVITNYHEGNPLLIEKVYKEKL